MADFLEGLSIFPLALTFGTYQFGLWCQKKGKTPLLNPILISVALVVGVLLIFGIDLGSYQAGTKGISWLLTPATVCLALPLYNQVKILKKSLGAILAGVLSGMLTSLVFVFAMCCLLRLDTQLTVALLPKSVTAAMSVVLTEQNGGIGALTATVTTTTGILGSLTGSALCKLLKIQDPVAQGVAFGTAAHVIGTSRANELGQVQGAVSSLSLVAAGLMTVVLFPIVCMFL